MVLRRVFLLAALRFVMFFVTTRHSSSPFASWTVRSRVCASPVSVPFMNPNMAAESSRTSKSSIMLMVISFNVSSVIGLC